MKVRLLNITISIFISTSLFAQNIVVRVKDCITAENLSHAIVYNQSRVAASGATDLNGIFRTKRSDSLQTSQTYRISHVGYEDYILSIQQNERKEDTLEACLKKQTQLLEEVMVLSSEWKKTLVGMDTMKVSNRNLENSSGWFFEEIGYHNGIYLRKNNLKNAILEEVNFLVTGEFKEPELFLIRILVPKKKVKGNRIIASDEFFDYLQEPLLHQVKQTGWQQVKINQLMRLPNQDFLLFIVQLESNNQSEKIKIPFANSFGAVDKNVFWAYQVSGGYSVNMQKNTKDFVPAIGVTYSYK